MGLIIKLLLIGAIGTIVYYLVFTILSGDLLASSRVNRRVKHLTKMNEINGANVNKNSQHGSSVFSFIVSDKFKRNLMTSGIKLKAEEYVVFWIVVTLLPMMLYSLIKGFSFMSLIIAGICFFSVPAWVKTARKKRMHKYN